MISTFAAPAGATESRGMLAARVHQSIAEELESQHDLDLHTAAAVAVWHRGEQLVDVLHPAARRAGGPTPLFRAFSAGKPLAAAVLWRLMDAGRLELDAPVADYWPEFAQSGKHGVTVKHVLTHTAGLAPDSTRSDVDWTDWGRVVDSIAMAEPSHEPGSAMQYHAFTFGWIVAELATRVTGERFETLFAREVCQPLGLRDTYFVIRRDQDHLLRRIVELRTSRDFMDPELPQKMDGLLLLEINMPAGSCVTTASDLARFYAALVDGFGPPPTSPSIDGASDGAMASSAMPAVTTMVDGVASGAAERNGSTGDGDIAADSVSASISTSASAERTDGERETTGGAGTRACPTCARARARALGDGGAEAAVAEEPDVAVTSTAPAMATDARADAAGATAQDRQDGDGCPMCARARAAVEGQRAASGTVGDAATESMSVGADGVGASAEMAARSDGAVAPSVTASSGECVVCARRREVLGVEAADDHDATQARTAASDGMPAAAMQGVASGATTTDGAAPAADAAVGAPEPRSEWLSLEMRRRIFEAHVDLFDLDVRRFVKFGLGVGLADHQPNRMAAPDGSGSFGHGGLGTCVAWADPEHELAAAILTDTAHPESVNYKRLNRISAAIRKALALEPGVVAEL